MTVIDNSESDRRRFFNKLNPPPFFQHIKTAAVFFNILKPPPFFSTY